MRARAARRLLSWLGEREPEMVELLKRLAGEETPSHEPAAQRGALTLLMGELERLGFAVRTVRAAGVGDHLLAWPRGRRRGVPFQLVVGHLDTVWPVGTLKRMPVRRADGRLEGPGVYDMKGGLVQLVFALRALRAIELEPGATPVVFVNSDEEIGSPDSTRHLRRLARRAARALVLEPSFGRAGALKTARKGVGRFELTVVGRASHAGLAPEAGVSAILELSHQIQRLFALNDGDRGITVNVGTIDGGLRPNVIAPQASALIEARVRTAEDAARVERALRELRPVQDGAALELSGGFARPPLERTARNRGLWRTAQAAASELGVELEQAAVGGASDGNTTSRFTATLDGLGPVGGGAHAPDEHVVVSQLAERAALLGLLLVAPVEGG
ncbi:MAG: M20 family metallopeptidase [Nocardioidaceae bacterium]